MTHRRGLTLVELLAALVLSGLMVGSVLGVLSSLTRGQRVVLAGHGVPETWQVQLDGMLQWDLENSRSIRLTETGFLLEGYAGRDLSTRLPIHCPSVISYEVVASEKRKHLIRREIHPELLNLENSITEFICFDVDDIIVVPPSVVFGSSVESKDRLGDGPLPNRMSVRLLATGDAKVIYARTFNLR